MTSPGNWNRNPWNRGKAKAPRQSIGLSPVMQALVRARVRQQCTQAWLAERTGYAVTTVQQYEAGTRKVPLAYSEAAAQVLGMRVVVQWEAGQG
jgi:DNA-binding XRE family transcriptional regulator